MKQVKLKEDRLKEGVNILTQLLNNGIRENSLGYVELKSKITEWIHGDSSWDGIVHFQEYGRFAVVDLPKYNNRSAGIHFKVKKTN